MANDHEHPELHEDEQMARLLQSGYEAPEPSAKFTEQLFQKLDEAFAAAHPPLDVTTSSTEAADATTRALDTTNSAVPPSTIATASKHAASASRSRSSVSLRWAVTLATAASLLFAFALWNSQPAYGWAAMLRSLENCVWVQAVSQSAGLSGWISSSRGVLAIRSKDQIAYHDHGEQTAARYVADQEVIYQSDLPTAQQPSGSEALLSLLLRQDSTAGNSLEVPRYKVLSESWRHASGKGDSAAAVELHVTLQILGEQERKLRLVFVVDSETHLPQSVRSAGKQRANQAFEFSYPSEGPSSIYSLGIPQETLVVHSLTNLTAKQLTLAREAEAVQLLARAQPPTRKPRQQNTEAANQENALDNRPTDTLVTQETEIVTLPATPSSEAADVIVPAPRITPAPRTEEEPEVFTWTLPQQPRAVPALVGQVNEQLARCWQEQGVTPAEPATDAEFLRRVYLDLAGRIPMVSEVYSFLEDPDDNRRERLVDELLASRDHATHLATVWRKVLLPEGVETNVYGGTDKFDQWLADRFERNLPYDQLVSQLLLAEGRVSDSGPILFYAALKLNPEELAAKTARTFLGMRMECAQCHDHPFDESISQEDFWGFAAHFAQISRPQGKMEMTSSVLRVRDNQRGEVMLPDSDEVVPPTLPYEIQAAFTEPVDNDAAISRREVLVDWLTSKQNGRFATATVNRVWEHLFGQGLVDPVDDIRADNPAACPELLTELSKDFAASNYNLRRLLRALVLSDTYQLSSRSASDEPSQTLAFARMNMKSFTADQLFDCIGVATQHEALGGPNAGNGALSRIGNNAREAFIAQFRAPPGQRTNYHAGIPQALTLMHGSLVHGATDLASSGLLKSLNAPFFNNEQRIDTLFLATLSRYPDAEEREQMLAYVESATDDEQRSQALGDILWALLNSAEFTFIH